MSIDVGLPSGSLADLSIGAGGIRETEARTRASVAIRNTSTQRWGDHASVTVGYSSCRPGSLRPLTALAGATQPLPGGLYPGAYTTIDLVIDRSLTPGYYYTARVTITSRDYQVADNNELIYAFFLEDDGRVTPIRD